MNTLSVENNLGKSCEKIANLSQFLNIKDVFKSRTVTIEKEGAKRRTILTMIGDAKFNIKDEKKLELASILINRWMLFDVGSGKSAYVKHVASKTSNMLYQIILAEEKEWCGVYQISLKGKDIEVFGETINGKNTLIVESSGNYDVAVFKDKEGEQYTITRLDYDTDEEFKEALLEANLIDDVDIDIYYKPDAIAKPYMDRVLPRIVLQ